MTEENRNAGSTSWNFRRKKLNQRMLISVGCLACAFAGATFATTPESVSSALILGGFAMLAADAAFYTGGAIFNDVKK